MLAQPPELVDRVAEHPDVALHAKRWGVLPEGESNIVAREIGVVAARVIATAKLAPSRLQN